MWEMHWGFPLGSGHGKKVTLPSGLTLAGGPQAPAHTELPPRNVHPAGSGASVHSQFSLTQSSAQFSVTLPATQGHPPWDWVRPPRQLGHVTVPFASSQMFPSSNLTQK